MELNMVTYSKNEMVGITQLGKSLGAYLDKINNKTLSKLTIIRRNKPEAVLIDIDEYEKLQRAYDLLEQKEIENILSNMTKEEKKVSHPKIIEFEI